MNEHDYKILWHCLRRIELGVHEKNNGEMPLRDARAIARLALNVVSEPNDVLPGYDR